MNNRPLNKKYGISSNRYIELMHFSLQYSEWKAIIGKGSCGEEYEIAKEKIRLVEDTVNEAAGELSTYIMKAVTTKATYENIRLLDSVPCGKNEFYETRRKYFYLLDKKRK